MMHHFDLFSSHHLTQTKLHHLIVLRTDHLVAVAAAVAHQLAAVHRGIAGRIAAAAVRSVRITVRTGQQFVVHRALAHHVTGTV